MRNLLYSTEERVYFKDLHSRFLLVSAGWLAAVAPGHTVEEIIGKTDFDFFSEEHAAAAFEDEQQIIRTGEPIVGKLERETFRDRTGPWVSTTKMPLRDEHGQIIGTFGISRDVTAQVKAENALAYQVLHDPVTGLANRVALMDRLSQALAALERQPGRLAVLYVDLDHFKADQRLVRSRRRRPSARRGRAPALAPVSKCRHRRPPRRRRIRRAVRGAQRRR